MVENLESRRKRARIEEALTSTDGRNSYYDERVTKILNSLSSLLNEFPELKYIIDFGNLQAITEAAVEKYAKDLEAKNRKDIILTNYGQETSPLYSLPDEVLSNCLSYVGKGHFGVVAPASKKLNKVYKAEFGQETAYLEMATSVNLANHCLNELCKSSEEKDELFKAAAVNGNLDILRYADLNGYDLFPLVELKYRGVNIHNGVDQFYAYENAMRNKVMSFKLVERGHLHVLKYLHEELKYFFGLQRYFIPAIEHGKLDILKWLQSIGCTDKTPLNTESDCFCEYAIKSGNLEMLKWLLQNGYEIKESKQSRNTSILATAISSKSLEMIQYCLDLGYDELHHFSVWLVIRETKNVEVFRLMHDRGFQFDTISLYNWCCGYFNITDSFEIIKFLRSISLPWDNGIIQCIIAYGSLEMIKYAHENGYLWTNRGHEYTYLLLGDRFSPEKFEYLIENGCTLDHDNISKDTLVRKEDFTILDYFIGKNTKFDNELYKYIFNWHDDPWFEGMSYILEKGKDVQNFKSIEEVLHTRKEIDKIKYLHSHGLPWCLDSTRNTHLLSEIACYYDLKDVKWAYENGCKGGDLVQYVEEEWEKDGIRHTDLWKENQAFFEENGMLDYCFLEKVGIKKLDPMKVQAIGDAQLESIDSWFQMGYSNLKSLVEFGYTFRSESERESVTKEAFEKCCKDLSQKKESHRKRFAIIRQIGVREL
ncbi:hypothetical protein CTEN210_02722 [Chaetoceros tenuissimus]|uniref:Ankyrin repeat protein n=1 Tax=Chaetoceros tenuissimus TaxID=426638 RepID=A0AAD3H147_9STRA|nr:hypothetical protein CTEN210_02722 [Chaetoceros tenuissimus]